MYTPQQSGRPILVTGAHRSGTTWAANVLALSPGVVLPGREPFNTGPRQWALDGLLAHDYAYVPESGVERDAARAFSAVLEGRVPRLVGRQGRRQLQWLSPLHRRVIVKDPLAAMSAAWLQSTFAMQVVVMIRHPAAFAASLRRVGWQFDWSTFLRQPNLLAGPLASMWPALQSLPDEEMARHGLLWRCIYTVLQRHEGQLGWWFVRHEDLARRPEEMFRWMREGLGLSAPGNGDAALRSLTTGPRAPRRGRVHQLRRASAETTRQWRDLLTEGEAATVMEHAGPLAQAWYGGR